MSDETKTEGLRANATPTPPLTEALIKEGLRSSVKMGEVGSMIGVIGMFAALMLAAMTFQVWPLLLFLLAAAFAVIGEANRRQAIKVLRKAGYEVDGEGAMQELGRPTDATNREAGDPVGRTTAERAARVMAAALRLYHGDEDKAVRFLLAEHAMLDGQAPWPLALGSEAGAAAVMDLLARADAGVAV